MHHPDLSRARWRRSTRSSGGGGNSNCVEAAYVGSVVIRDSKDIAGLTYPVLLTDEEGWAGFLAGVKSGGFTA
ncbi:hypothetical protein Pen01_36250 [Phytomonospora endophytica]|nr:DUF397 domain-containing protein [Phytomonospora endophytica]GIG67330.1 hypothetical protein Pen01_36250 [Phytomonospora endophytica]